MSFVEKCRAAAVARVNAAAEAQVEAQTAAHRRLNDRLNNAHFRIVDIVTAAVEKCIVQSIEDSRTDFYTDCCGTHVVYKWAWNERGDTFSFYIDHEAVIRLGLEEVERHAAKGFVSEELGLLRDQTQSNLTNYVFRAIEKNKGFVYLGFFGGFTGMMTYTI